MRQGEVWYADLNPSQGIKQAGRDPVVILSGNLLNQHLSIVIVAPLTTKVKKYKGNPIFRPSKENGLKDESEMLVFHIRSVSKNRLVEKIGTIEKPELELAIRTLNDILRF